MKQGKQQEEKEKRSDGINIKQVLILDKMNMGHFTIVKTQS